MKWFHGITWSTPISDIGWAWVLLALTLVALAWAAEIFLREWTKPIPPPKVARVPAQRRPQQPTGPGFVVPQRGHMSSPKRTQIR